jgi:hypothetical protein
MNNKYFYSFIIGCAMGSLFAVLFGTSEIDKGKQLTQQAQVLSVESDKSKFKANEIAQINLSSIGRIAAKDKELEELLLSKADLSLVVDKQKEAISERDLLINGLNSENKHLRDALEAKDKAYRVQLEATKAYQEAIMEAKFKYGVGGTILGVFIGIAAK